MRWRNICWTSCIHDPIMITVPSRLIKIVNSRPRPEHAPAGSFLLSTVTAHNHDEISLMTIQHTLQRSTARFGARSSGGFTLSLDRLRECVHSLHHALLSIVACSFLLSVFENAFTPSSFCPYNRRLLISPAVVHKFYHSKPWGRAVGPPT
jgi:hypothetical protein